MHASTGLGHIEIAHERLDVGAAACISALGHSSTSQEGPNPAVRMGPEDTVRVGMAA